MPRRDDDLLDTLSIFPENDHSRLRAEPTAKVTRKSSSEAAGSRQHMYLFILWTAVVLLVACSGYFHYLNTRQSELNQKLQQRLESLETQLGMTTSSATQASQSLGDKVAELDTRLKATDGEIRKLWSITNDKNKKILDGHSSKLDEIAKQMTSIQNAVGDMKKSSDQTDKAISETARKAESIEKIANAASKSIGEINSAIKELQQKIAQSEPLVREANQQAVMAQEQSEQMQAKISELGKRVSAQDETLKSIDTFRRSVNVDLNKLKQQTMGSTTLQQP